MSVLNAIASGDVVGHIYETGNYTPTANTQNMTISFANEHTARPFMIVLIDTFFFNNSTTMSACYSWSFIDWSQFVGAVAVTPAYGVVMKDYTPASGQTTMRNQTINIQTEADLSNYATSTQFFPGAYGSTYNFKANHIYKWIAIWA